MRRNAHTLVELALVVAIMAVMAAVTIPRLNWNITRRKTVDQVAHKLVGDLRKTRSMALRDAATNDIGFALRLVGDGAGFTGYVIRDLKNSIAVYTTTFDSGVDITLTGIIQRFAFDPVGALQGNENRQIRISGDDKAFTITFVLATGAIKWQED